MSHAVHLTLDLPDSLAGLPEQELADRIRLLLLIHEVRAGRLTRASAAQAYGTTLDDFLILAGRHGLYAIDYDVEDFERELWALPGPKAR